MCVPKTCVPHLSNYKAKKNTVFVPNFRLPSTYQTYLIVHYAFKLFYKNWIQAYKKAEAIYNNINSTESVQRPNDRCSGCSYYLTGNLNDLKSSERSADSNRGSNQSLHITTVSCQILMIIGSILRHCKLLSPTFTICEQGASIAPKLSIIWTPKCSLLAHIGGESYRWKNCDEKDFTVFQDGIRFVAITEHCFKCQVSGYLSGSNKFLSCIFVPSVPNMNHWHQLKYMHSWHRPLCHSVDLGLKSCTLERHTFTGFAPLDMFRITRTQRKVILNENTAPCSPTEMIAV